MEGAHCWQSLTATVAVHAVARQTSSLAQQGTSAAVALPLLFQ